MSVSSPAPPSMASSPGPPSSQWPQAPAPTPGDPSRPDDRGQAQPGTGQPQADERAGSALQITGVVVAGRRVTLTGIAGRALRGTPLVVRERRGGRLLARGRVAANGRVTVTFTLGTRRRTAILEAAGRPVTGQLRFDPIFAQLAASGTARTVRVRGRLAVGNGRRARISIQRTADGTRWTAAGTLAVRRGRFDARLTLPAGTRQLRVRATVGGRTATSIPLAVPTGG
jgi:hypothetical protein